jgi:beta-xylosidase
MNMKIIIKYLLCIVVLLGYSCTKPLKPIRSGEIWPDADGVHINAHGGGLLYHDGMYYWYGENKCDTTSAAMVGVMCYSSKNLTDWKNEGVALAVEDDPNSDITKHCILERPKVIYNEKTKKFVMWFHLELKGKGYTAARTGLAVSETPIGPYKFLRSERVNAGKLPFDMTEDQKAVMDTLTDAYYPKAWTPEWVDAVTKGLFLKRDLEGGQMARDMQLFVDDDGKAYHVFASEENNTLQIAELSEDYLSHSGKYVRVALSGQNEAPALFKRNGKYWMITSGCTGWAPNEARMFSADNIMGPWTQHPNPCVGPNKELTFGGQSTYVLKVEGMDDAYIFMADIWRPKHPSDARYIWLPIQFKEDDTPVVEWMDSWTLDYFNSKRK